MTNELKQMEKDLINKYTEKVVLEYKAQCDDAVTLLLIGSEVEDKKGLEQAKKEYYNEAEEMLEKIPQDYRKFRELLVEEF